jgi:hypothetical protein
MNAVQMAEEMSKQQLLARMRSFVAAEAKKRKVEPWVVVGHIFGIGSGVSQALWKNHISEAEGEES